MHLWYFPTYTVVLDISFDFLLTPILGNKKYFILGSQWHLPKIDVCL